ncbi:MAG: O-antigen ligase family protein [Gammaproteobacteria bacterium]|nr:MAG: O-antigen ligase family protein [Gammaproteobacteria bacterium]
MSRAATGFRPGTLQIYGIAAALIVVAWASLGALGMDPGGDGRMLLTAVAALILTPAMLRDPFGMLCLILFLLPFSLGVLQIEIGIVTFNPYTLGIMAALLVAVAGLGMGRLRYRSAPEDLGVLLLGISFLLSTLRAHDKVQAGFLAFHGVFIPVVTYFALKTLVHTPDQYRKALVAFVGGITAFALYGLFEFARNPVRLHVLNMPSISAAALLTTGLIVIMYSGWWRKPLAMLAALVLFGALLATFSRGYLVLLLLTPLFFRILRRGHATTLIVAMLVASLLGTLLLVQTSEMFEVEGLDKGQEQTAERLTDPGFWLNSLYGRGRYYAVGLQEFARSPFLGNGFHQNFVSTAGRAVVWHNFHVEWLEYGGLSAYLLYVTVLILHFRGMSRAARTRRAVAVNLTAFFVILLNGLTNSFTAGISPILGFLLMALNHAHQDHVPDAQNSTTGATARRDPVQRPRTSGTRYTPQVRRRPAPRSAPAGQPRDSGP